MKKNLSLEINLSLDNMSDRHRDRTSDILSCETQNANCDVQSMVKNDLSIAIEGLDDIFKDLRNLFDELDFHEQSTKLDNEKCENVNSCELIKKENLIDAYCPKETLINEDRQRHLSVTKVISSNSPTLMSQKGEILDEVSIVNVCVGPSKVELSVPKLGKIEDNQKSSDPLKKQSPEKPEITRILEQIRSKRASRDTKKVGDKVPILNNTPEFQKKRRSILEKKLKSEGQSGDTSIQNGQKGNIQLTLKQAFDKNRSQNVAKKWRPC